MCVCKDVAFKQIKKKKKKILKKKKNSNHRLLKDLLTCKHTHTQLHTQAHRRVYEVHAKSVSNQEEKKKKGIRKKKRKSEN